MPRRTRLWFRVYSVEPISWFTISATLQWVLLWMFFPVLVTCQTHLRIIDGAYCFSTLVRLVIWNLITLEVDEEEEEEED